MQCPQCSAAVADSSRFCTSCGATITQPAPVDKTMALPNLPPMASPVDKTQAINPAQVPTAQPNYGPSAPVQSNYGPQAQPNVYPQQGFSQSQNYGQLPPSNYGQAPMGYAVPNQGGYAAIPAANGSIPAILMIVSALAILIGIFLPLIVITGTNISLLQMLDPQYAQDVVSDGAAIFVYGVPAGAGLMLLLSIMALIKRRNLWGGLNILPSLFVLGITGLLLIGAAVSDEIDQAGIGLILMTVSAGVGLFASIAFLIRKKQPR